MNHYEPARLVSLGIAFIVSVVLVFGSGSVLLSLRVVNVVQAVDMPDAPVTQDTVTAGKDEEDNDDNEGDEDNDQPDDLPDPEDAPVTTETFTSGEDDEEQKEDTKQPTNQELEQNFEDAIKKQSGEKLSPDECKKRGIIDGSVSRFDNTNLNECMAGLGTEGVGEYIGGYITGCMDLGRDILSCQNDVKPVIAASAPKSD